MCVCVGGGGGGLRTVAARVFTRKRTASVIRDENKRSYDTNDKNNVAMIRDGP